MNISYYHVNAFTNTLFQGNPASVCMLTEALSEQQMQKIAVENQLPVTAFVQSKGDRYSIRWITPDGELPLCGHGTLAAAYVLFHELKIAQQEITFDSPKAGLLTVRRVGNKIELNFPVASMHALLESTDPLAEALGCKVTEVYQTNGRVLVVLPNEATVKNLQPNFERLKSLKLGGIVVSAPGDTVDFVSRTFYPEKFMPEDAVTGSSHCMLVPYWANRLGKTRLHAYQVSSRGGELWCELSNDRVLLQGEAVLYSKGSITL